MTQCVCEVKATALTESHARCLLFPDKTIPYGKIDLKQWSAMSDSISNDASTSKKKPVLPDVASINESLRQIYVEGSNGGEGTRRNYAFANIKSARTVRLGFTTLLHEGWTWGGHGGRHNDRARKGGKLGFGLGGGTTPTGGKLVTDGFTVRPVWGGNKLYLYYYGADQLSKSFGDAISADFTMPIGQPFRIEFEVVVNSYPEAADGLVRFRADCKAWRTLRTGMKMMSSDRPAVDSLIYSSFFGGSAGRWEPDGVAVASFSDIVVHSEP